MIFLYYTMNTNPKVRCDFWVAKIIYGSDNMNVLKFKSFDDYEQEQYDLNLPNLPNLTNNQQKTFFTYPTETECNNLQSYLNTILNRFVKVDFLIGNDNLIFKEGILKEVGCDYILLEMIDSNDLLVCDIYSIKFVQII